MIRTKKREHSRKPDELYKIIEKCSWGPYLELFARGTRKKWTSWVIKSQSKKYKISWKTYKLNSQKNFLNINFKNISVNHLGHDLNSGFLFNFNCSITIL